ncbi:hypothetical protein BH23ACT9_BH23ACT9_12720 [soil metagenome]
MTPDATSARTGGAFGDLLVRLAGDRPDAVVVAGVDPGPAAWFAEVWPERVLTVPPLQARMAIAEGIVRGGGAALVVLEPQATVLPVDVGAGIVVISQTPAHLHLAHRAGVVVVQPGWDEDVPLALAGALEDPRTVLLHLPATVGEGTDRPPVPLALPLGDPRVLHRGAAGLVIGAGATAPAAAAVAAHLRGRHLEVTALDMTVITPGSGLDAALLHEHLLVGPHSTPRAAALEAVPVGTDPGDLASRVGAVLHPPTGR